MKPSGGGQQRGPNPGQQRRPREAVFRRPSLEPLGISWNGRKEPWVFLAADVNKGSEGALRVAVEVLRAVLGVKDIEGFSKPVGVSLGRAAEDVEIFFFMVNVMAHELACRTNGKTFGREFKVRVRGEVEDDLAVFTQRDDGDDSLGPEIAIVGKSVMVAVAAEKCRKELDVVFADDFEELIESLKGECIVGFIASGHDGHEREVVASGGCNQMVVSVSEDVAVPVGVIAPSGGG